MRGHFGSIEANFQFFINKLNHEIFLLSEIVAVSVLSFCFFITINHFRKRRKAVKLLAAIANPIVNFGAECGDPDGPPVARPTAFAKDLAAAAQSKAVPLAPLQTILSKLIDAGVPATEIPNRLLAAADRLNALRESLANWQDEGPGHAQICSEVLALIDSGDFEAAGDALRRGREAGWTFPMATCREEAEFYAREAMIESLQLRFIAAAENYAAAAALVEDGGGKDAWHFLIEQARALYENGREFGTRESMLLAVKTCHRALGLAGREQAPLDWAVTKRHLGDALLLLGERDKNSGQLREAVEAYLGALEEWSRDGAPLDRAKAQNNLGNALQLLGEQESDPERLRQAAEAYRAALGECSRETAPFEWSQAYNRLGDTLAVLGLEEGEGERLKEAVDAYREALDGVNRELAPLDYAMTQNNLGKALEALGESETGTGLLHQAVAAYQAALDERCRDLAPLNKATTNINLGNALVTIAERENSNAMLEEAASAYRAALDARPAEGAPLDTAKTHINLAYTLGALWNRTRNRKTLDEALRAVEAALGLIEQIGAKEHIPAAQLVHDTILAAMGHGEASANAA
jgi:tetratricopeptide (TPR) repeat protein